jgi:regulator of protease activity HflC (stomatin/prohibitin superfamily)
MSRREEEEEIFPRGFVKGAVVALGAIAIGFFAMNNVYFIDEGESAVVTRLGEVRETWDPGVHVKLPFVDTVYKYSTRIQKNVFEGTDQHKLTAYSSDNQIIDSYRVSIIWSYDRDRLEDVYRYFGASDKENPQAIDRVVYPILQQTSRVIFGQFVSTTIVQQRDKLDNMLDEQLKTHLAKYPIKIISVQIENVNFSSTFEAMIEATAQKKQEIEKAKNELRLIEISSQQKVAQADADNKAIKLRADADAYRVTVQAKAEAEAIRIKAEALRTNKELIDLTIAERWDGKLPTTSLGNSVPMINLKRE